MAAVGGHCEVAAHPRKGTVVRLTCRVGYVVRLGLSAYDGLHDEDLVLELIGEPFGVGAGHAVR